MASHQESRTLFSPLCSIKENVRGNDILLFPSQVQYDPVRYSLTWLNVLLYRNLQLIHCYSPDHSFSLFTL